MTNAVEPLQYVVDLVHSRPEIREVELSSYTNFPESLHDVRVNQRTPASAIHEQFAKLLAALPAGQEIAFHSRVQVLTAQGQSTRHIPLVDFKTADRESAERAASALVEEHAAPRSALFASGRSYHLYIDTLLTEDDWVRFMGRVLLLNPRKGPAVVDSRWIGHRLMSGFGALRWSANSPPYTRPPQLLRHSWFERA